MFTKTFFSASLWATLFSLFIFSQSYSQTISGVIIDITSNEPLPGAAVRQVGTARGVVTQMDGSFEFTLTEGESKQLLITYVGFKDKTVDVSVRQKDIKIYLEPNTYIGDDIFVDATRVDESTPFTYTNISKEELEERNLGQDVPYLLNQAPSVVTTSDAGAGIGYTGIRIRGVDPARINVTINGIPVNDAESHGVFWVDLPDIASSLENIQIQRGVGTSTNGAAAFGGSINLQTNTSRTDAFAEVNTGIGSFNTRKANIQLGSGLMENGWMFEGRLSKILSDGYIDRASADLNSFYLSGSKRGERSIFRADVFSGKEITYQAWNGVPEPVLESNAAELETYIGDAFLTEDGTNHWRANLGNRQFNQFTYKNQVDNYRQDYYQLHYSYEINPSWNANASLHYTRGEGYYEEYKAGEDLSEYGIVADTATSDLVRRRWLDNHYYGGVFSTKYDNENWDLTIGGGVHQYDGAHFGEVIWARFAGDSETEERYYDNDGDKLDMNIFAKFNYELSEELNVYGDVQIRTINYDFLGIGNDGFGNLVPINQTDKLTFFNPKAGIVYRNYAGDRAFLSFGVASKEPTRDEYVNSTAQSRPNHETLYNVEAGYTKDFGTSLIGLSAYGMFYNDQLVLTGQVNDVGEYIRNNVESSYRIGLELEGAVQLTEQIQWAANATLSQNKIAEISEYIDDYDAGGQLERTFPDTDIAFSPNLIANSIISFTKDGFVGELITKYVSKQYLDNTQNDARSIDAYLVNDVRLSYRLSEPGFAKAITANLLVNNVLNHEYVSNGYTYGYIYGGEQRFNYYYPQAGRNFLLQIKWEF